MMVYTIEELVVAPTCKPPKRKRRAASCGRGDYMDVLSFCNLSVGPQGEPPLALLSQAD
jgi:hypothetical protein